MSNLKHFCRSVGRIKAPNNFKNVKAHAPMGRIFTKKRKILPFWGLRSHPRALIGVKFCTANGTQVPLSYAKFRMIWCNESPLQGENADFWPVSKNNTSSLPLRGNPAGNQKKQTPHFRTYSRRALFDLPQTLHGDRARRAHHKM